MKWRALSISVLLLACGEEALITNNVPGTNSSSNNSTSNNPSTNNTTIIGTACETSEECTPQAPICQENVLVRMTGNGLCSSETGICNYFRVTERIDCGVTVQTCENGACVDNACTNTVCDTPSNRCEGQILFFYPTASRCELPAGTCVNTQASADCEAMGAECIVDQCVGACVGVTCNALPAPVCDNDVAVTSAGGVCNPDTGGCSYTETRTDCTTTDQVCRNGACVTDLCANTMCNTPPAAFCDDTVAVTYGQGICNAADGSCTYADTRTDCAAAGSLCENGACRNITPAAGNLIITEVMHSPLAVTGEFGEWFEIRNVSTREINIDGMVIGSGGDIDYTVQLGGPVLLAPNTTYVFGNNSDFATNNNVPVSAAYTGITLDTADSLTLKVGAATITTLTWDTAAGWPATAGASMNFGAQHPASGNATAANWCDSTTVLGIDFGTPGAANINCP